MTGVLRQRRPDQTGAILTCATALLLSCCGLPRNFAELPLDRKLQTYERHFRYGGLGWFEAPSLISWHGVPAAEAMIKCLRNPSSSIPDSEALQMIEMVQSRGCDLKGTAVESNLSDLIASGRFLLNSSDRLTADTILKQIGEGRHLAPGVVDGLRGGPCETE